MKVPSCLMMDIRKRLKNIECAWSGRRGGHNRWREGVKGVRGGGYGPSRG